MSTKEDPVEKLIAGTIAIALIPVQPVVWGWAVSKLWNWFLTTPPFGLSAISIPQAAGALLTLSAISLMLVPHTPSDRGIAEIIGATLVKWVVAAILVAVGALYHSYL